MTRTYHLLFVFAFSWVCAMAQPHPNSDAEPGELNVIVVDPFGTRIAGIEVLLDVQTGSKRGRFKWQLGSVIPYGTYNIEVRAPGFTARSQTVDVQNRLVEVVVCLRPAPIGPAQSIADVRLPMPGLDPDCNHVLLMPLFCSNGKPPVVGRLFRGLVVFNGLEGGRYIAAAVSPEKLCSASAYDISETGAKPILTKKE